MDKIADKKIAIIGVGHIGKALYEGLLKSGVDENTIALSNDLSTNQKVAEEANIIFIALQPYHVKEVLTSITRALESKVVVSLATGVTVKRLRHLLNGSPNTIRIMPNIPSAQNKGVIGLYADDKVDSQKLKEVLELISRLGHVLELKQEKDIDAVTLIAACGPALVAYFIDMLSTYGNELGLGKEEAQTVALDTFRGTIDHLKATNQTTQELIDAVTTKGGVTESIIDSFNREQFKEKYKAAMDQGLDKIKEITKNVSEED